MQTSFNMRGAMTFYEFSYKFVNKNQNFMSKFKIVYSGSIKAKTSCNKDEVKDISQYCVQQIEDSV
jgi:hypothetical protein